MLSKFFYRKNFSVFSKLKEYMKSDSQSKASIFTAGQFDIDKLRIEYEGEGEDAKSKDKHIANKGIKTKKLEESVLTEEEMKLYSDIPNQVIRYQRDIKLELQEIKDRKIMDELINRLNKEDVTEQIKKTSSSKHKSIWQKFEEYEISNDGKISLPHISGAPTFDNMNSYLEWKAEKLKELRKEIFEKLTPMEYYITQNKGTERPYTGDYWDTNNVGVYACKVCTQRLFSSTHKYNSDSGHATFWNFIPFSLNFVDDNLDFPKPTQSLYPLQLANSQPVKRIICSNCESHVGHVFEDGPAPFFRRLNVNSASVKFLDIGWFESPDSIKKRKALMELLDKERKVFFENSKIQRMKKEMPGIHDYIMNHITPLERDMNYREIEKKFNEKESVSYKTML